MIELVGGWRVYLGATDRPRQDRPSVRSRSCMCVYVCASLSRSLVRSRKEGRESRKVCSVLVRCAVIDDRGLIVCALDGEYVFRIIQLEKKNTRILYYTEPIPAYWY